MDPTAIEQQVRQQMEERSQVRDMLQNRGRCPFRSMVLPLHRTRPCWSTCTGRPCGATTFAPAPAGASSSPAAHCTSTIEQATINVGTMSLCLLPIRQHHASQAHDDRNEARKLTPSERREKKLARLIGDPGPDTLVAVYRVRRLNILCPVCACFVLQSHALSRATATKQHEMQVL